MKKLIPLLLVLMSVGLHSQEAKYWEKIMVSFIKSRYTKFLYVIFILFFFISSPVITSIKGLVKDVKGNPVDAKVYGIGGGGFLFEIQTNNGEFYWKYWSDCLLAIPSDSNLVPGYYRKDMVATPFLDFATHLDPYDTADIKEIIFDTLTPTSGPGYLYGIVDIIMYPKIEKKEENPLLLDDSVFIFLYVLDTENRTRKYLKLINYEPSQTDDPIEYIITDLDTGSYKLIIDAMHRSRYWNGERLFDTIYFAISDDNLGYNKDFYFYGGGSVEESDNIKNINIFPNPVKEFLDISFTSIFPMINVRVFNILGQEVFKYHYFTKSEEVNIQINLKNNPNGYYYLKFEGGNESLLVPFVIMK